MTIQTTPHNSLPDQDGIAYQLFSLLYRRYQEGSPLLPTEVAYQELAKVFGLSKDDLSLVRESNGESLWNNKVRYAKLSLESKSYVASKSRGFWTITEEGIKYYEQFLKFDGIAD